MSKELTLNEKLATIQTNLKAKKSRRNSFGNYLFRSAEDVLEATKPFLIELGVSITIREEVTELCGLPIMTSTATLSDGVYEIAATAVVAVDMNQKGMQAPQKFGSASSYAKKYSLGNLFLIDDTQDSDATNTHNKVETSEKPYLNENTPQFNEAVKFLKGAGTLDAIKSKYKVSAKTEKAINAQL